MSNILNGRRNISQKKENKPKNIVHPKNIHRDKINEIFNEILERDVDNASLQKYIIKLMDNNYTYEDIEYDLLNSNECSQLIDKKINEWVKNVN